MNTLNKIIFRNKSLRFLKLSVRGKFRKVTQPGLTRYNWDDQQYAKAEYEVKIFNLMIL
jgi:hypothetical protein